MSNRDHFKQAFVNERNAEIDARMGSGSRWGRIDTWTTVMVVVSIIAIIVLARMGAF